MTYLVYDLAVIAILILFAFWGARKGLILTLCSLAAVFVALVGASFLSNALAEPAAKVLEPAVTGSIHDTVASYYQRSPSEGAGETDWLSQIPLDQLLDPMRESGFFKGYIETFQKAVDDRATEIVTHAVQALAHFVAVQIARMVIFVLAFFAILAGWAFLSHTLDLVARLPVLSTVNRWGGAAAGLVRGALVLFIAAWVLRDGYIPQDAVDNTFLLHFFCTSSPLSFFL